MPKETTISVANIALAKNVLSGQEITLEEMRQLADCLINQRDFGYARKILGRARLRHEALGSWELRRKLAQRHAVATYKDPDLPSDEKLDRALEILQEGDELQTTSDQETLGLAGAIYKRRWELDGQKRWLERSLAYYLRGYKQGVGKDYGYTGINAAYVLDILASQEEGEAKAAQTTSDTAAVRRIESKQIREAIVEALKLIVEKQPEFKQQEWFLVTMGEAYFGLQDYERAGRWLKEAAEVPNVPEWQRESTARQLAGLARLQEQVGDSAEQASGTMAWEVLKEYLQQDIAALRSVFNGKIGLALSGGGFRASLFHIGVLAKLAELDVLRHVEVLSCVSGGSIIGAHYYLEVRNLLQQKPDQEVTREDYIEMVRRIERDFLAGVQTNIRTRVVAELKTNLKMIFKPDYSRTTRVGELYEEKIYSRIKDGEGDKPRWLNRLKVVPKGESPDFSPKNDNWRRRAKVPILVLNATSLNTGHNWQFTATWMGEPPSAIDSNVDGNYRLRRMYYEDAPQRYQHFRLGEAVAASSCVPGLFEPLALPDLYEHPTYEGEGEGRKITVRLVDGGVHDNQGTASLLEQGCTVLLVSDASGQMNSEDAPNNGLLGVPLRTNTVLQARVRQAQYRELEARRRAALLRGVMFIHLKKDLPVDPIDWISCPEPYDETDDGRPYEQRGPLTSYGIRKELQRRLAAIRTDLDSFSDVEAYALMASGYCMTEHEFPKCIEGFAPPPSERPAWQFLGFIKLLKQPEPPKRLVSILNTASKLAFKIWALSSILRFLTILTAVAAVIGLLFLIYLGWSALLALPVAVKVILIIPIAIVLFLGLFPVALRLFNYRKTAEESAVGLGISSLLIFARLHLHLFDKWYLHFGRPDHLQDGDKIKPN